MEVTDELGFTARAEKDIIVEFGPSELLPGWTSVDIANPPVSGGARFDDEGQTVSLVGSGRGIGGIEDEFHFIYRELTGDLSITARIINVIPPRMATPSQVGVMVRAGLRPGERNIAVLLENVNAPTELVFRLPYRSLPGRETKGRRTGSLRVPPNSWLRLERRGDVFTGFRSVDGTTWVELERLELPQFPTRLYVGLAASAGFSEPESVCAEISELEVVDSADPRFLRGDCDGDGKVGGNTTEAIALLRFAFLAGDEPPCLAACDAEANGAIGVTDALRILGFLFLGPRPPAPPFPECGKSDTETDVELGCEAPPKVCE